MARYPSATSLSGKVRSKTLPGSISRAGGRGRRSSTPPRESTRRGAADEADVAARAGGADDLHHRLLAADRLDHRVRAEPVRELLDPGHALVPSLLDDVGRAELERQLLSWRVAAHGDNPFRAEAPCSENGEQADRAIADHGDGLAGADLGGHRAEPAGAEHVGGGEKARDELVGRWLRRRDERAVGERDPGVLGLRALGADGLAVTQELWYPARQSSQVLSEAKNEPTANFPGRIVQTSSPTSSTIPAYSWPIGAGHL
jgi:hypothetical protein